MHSLLQHATTSRPAWHVAEAIQRHRLQKGWDQGDLARRAGVSRTTLYSLERGGTRSPRATTLARLAKALDVTVEDLLPAVVSPDAIRRPHLDSPDSPATGRQQDFDRCTNPLVSDVERDSPELFSGWSETDLYEMYSTCGVGGASAGRRRGVDAGGRSNGSDRAESETRSRP
jgi:transcriptional regulator with XRE-family HTH domain